MSHLYASVKGSRGEVTRCGTKKSGIVAHVRGWTVGVEVSVRYNAELDRDIATVYATSGSNASHPKKMICQFTNDGQKIVLG